LNPIDQLIERDVKNPKRIALVGDALTDVWISGRTEGCQEECLKFVESDLGEPVATPGGVLGAARQLLNWNASKNTFPGSRCEVKKRYLVGDKIVFRHDSHDRRLAAKDEELRRQTLASVRNDGYDAVLISDYDKGFITGSFVNQITQVVAQVVADVKQTPSTYYGCCLKMNSDYYRKNSEDSGWGQWSYFPHAVVTNGCRPPRMIGGCNVWEFPYNHYRPVLCRNHVGAGDCFAAHLTLALAHGLDWPHAATIAHSAGRVYVQHRFGRPPWPHEIRKDLDPVGGKVLPVTGLVPLRQSSPGRVVFANGVFRVPHTGHAWLLDWAKSQGDVLVVGVNDDESAARLRPGEFVLPLAERLHHLASLAAVDWVFPFSESDPCEVLKLLKPDALVKGREYEGARVPGDDLVGEVLFAPPGPFPGHSSSLVEAIRGDGP